MTETWITPILVIASTTFLWRVLGHRIDVIEREIHRMNERLDRHLEGHA